MSLSARASLRASGSARRPSVPDSGRCANEELLEVLRRSLPAGARLPVGARLDRDTADLAQIVARALARPLVESESYALRYQFSQLVTRNAELEQLLAAAPRITGRSVDTEVAMLERARLETQIAATQDAIDAARRETGRVAASNAEAAANLGLLAAQAERKRAELADAQRESREVGTSASPVERRRLELAGQVAADQAQIEVLRAGLAAARAGQGAVRADIGVEEEKRRSLTAQLAALQTAVGAAQSETPADAARLETLRHTTAQLRRDVDDQEVKNRAMTATLAERREEAKQMDEHLAQLRLQEAKATEQRRTLGEELAASNVELERDRKQWGILAAAIADLQPGIAADRVALEARRADIARVQHEVDERKRAQTEFERKADEEKRELAAAEARLMALEPEATRLRQLVQSASAEAARLQTQRRDLVARQKTLIDDLIKVAFAANDRTGQLNAPTPPTAEVALREATEAVAVLQAFVTTRTADNKADDETLINESARGDALAAELVRLDTARADEELARAELERKLRECETKRTGFDAERASLEQKSERKDKLVADSDILVEQLREQIRLLNGTNERLIAANSRYVREIGALRQNP